MKRLWILAVAAALAPALAVACGACIEDRVAAAYDHAVIDEAIAKHRQVVFVAVDGPVNMKELVARVRGAAPRVKGVQAGTLRTSVSPAAFSFALDARGDPRAALEAFRKAIGKPQAQLTLVRLMRDGVLLDPT